MASTGHEHVFKINFLINELMSSQRKYLTSQHKDLTRRHKDLASQHKYYAIEGRNMPPYINTTRIFE